MEGGEHAFLVFCKGLDPSLSSYRVPSSASIKNIKGPQGMPKGQP